MVHVEPIAPGEEDVTTIVRLLAARHGLGAHGIRIYEENRQRWLELHLEVSESLLLDEAHRQATEFERALRQSLPGVTRIITHIEPVGDAAATVRGEPAGQLQVQKAIADFLQDYPLAVKPHDVRVQLAGGELAVSFHCTLDAVDGHHRGPRVDRPSGRVSPRPRTGLGPRGDSRRAREAAAATENVSRACRHFDRLVRLQFMKTRHAPAIVLGLLYLCFLGLSDYLGHAVARPYRDPFQRQRTTGRLDESLFILAILFGVRVCVPVFCGSHLLCFTVRAEWRFQHCSPRLLACA